LFSLTTSKETAGAAVSVSLLVPWCQPSCCEESPPQIPGTTGISMILRKKLDLFLEIKAFSQVSQILGMIQAPFAVL